MAANLNRELNKIKKLILSLGGMAEHRLKKATEALEKGDVSIAQSIIDTDTEIDELEVDIEEECLKLLALYQPVAIDLRYIVAVIKINNDLERVGDEAVNIARRVKSIAGANLGQFNFYDYTHMTDMVTNMLKLGLDALVELDDEIAVSVKTMDTQVNALRNEAYDSMKLALVKSPDNAGAIVNRYLIARHLERIGDHATNIAEEVTYLASGKIVRHGK